ncbi:MAG TPA: DUF411 domain-containing protein [Allosphingosinicella sp.]|nr:DUF411 domain-containing protein [Allosphingosinicella sp.]
MTIAADNFSRRLVVSGGLALGGFLFVGCAPSDGAEGDAAAAAPAAGAAAAMTVWRDPSCGCCEAWARLAGDAGYEVRLVDDPDMAAVKRRLGVPAALGSCHSALVGGYAIEGHVPFAPIRRLLRERPRGVKGLAVPGMPRGSPGMEMPDGSTDEFAVMAFDAAGRSAPYRA